MFDLEMIKSVYSRMTQRVGAARTVAKRPLTLAEKILYTHLYQGPAREAFKRGVSYVEFSPDRVAMQDATAQMALLQFMMAGKDEAAVPTTVHCDHLIRGHVGADQDLTLANEENREVYSFLSDVSNRYKLGFWKPGSGIIHQTVLENYAFPGGLMVGTDSHTPNAGGLGMCAIGVGGADAVDVMAGFSWEVLQPNIVGVKLTGKLNGWTAPKDVILKLLGMLTVKGGTNRIIEYFGEGCESLSCTGKATICNMGAELGATCSVFPYDQRMGDYLRATNRTELADLADANADLLTADDGCEYDEVYEIDLSTLEPHLVGPHTPDLAHTISDMAADCEREGYPVEVRAALIGSCTNSSYEDIYRAADIAKQALANNTKMSANLFISPGSEQVYATIKRDGLLDILEQVGATVLTNACGPCIGQWQRDDIEPGIPNSIVTSFNRNFRARNDANPDTLGFIGSPEMVMVLGLSGRLDFNPLTGALTNEDGQEWQLSAPAIAPDIPESGFEIKRDGYQHPTANDAGEVTVDPSSERLQLLEPFKVIPAESYREMPLLLKTIGKTTTDHISPAGKWLKFRGHLDNIANNMFTGATNAFSGATGTTKNPLNGESGQPVPAVAREIRAAGKHWVVVGDENYGEGSSREHAAMCPRLLGGGVVITRSFARIHETNLKKQGVLAFTFADASSWELVQEDDTVSIEGLADLAPGSDVFAVFNHSDGSSDRVQIKHTLNSEQI
ncbi:MAG: aconitate hydratase, partial [Planctomycetota bacterium]|nr:aconitate hydratase [Planctomycetota bacterium]